jgi:hypothetical protein
LKLGRKSTSSMRTRHRQVAVALLTRRPCAADATTRRASDDLPSGGDAALTIGDKVEARTRVGADWTPGTVVSVNNDGTCDIRFADKTERKWVAPSNVRRASRQPAAKTPTRRGSTATTGAKPTALSPLGSNGISFSLTLDRIVTA